MRNGVVEQDVTVLCDSGAWTVGTHVCGGGVAPLRDDAACAAPSRAAAGQRDPVRRFLG